MKTWAWFCLRTLIFVVALVAVFFGAARVIATNESLWVNNGVFTKTLVAENITGDNSPYFNRACDKVSQRTNKYSWNGHSEIKSGYYDLTNNCWTKTTYGLYGTGNDGEYIRFGDTGAVAHLSAGSLYNKIALPNSDKLIMTSSSQTGGRDWYVYDKLETTLVESLSGDDYGRAMDTYSLSDAPSYWILKAPGTNQNMGVIQSGYSNNGKWAVVLSNLNGYSTLLRLNLDTRELLPFSTPFPYGGPGGNPDFGLAISNDGRYVVTAIDDNRMGRFVVYDLSTCVPIPNQPAEVATGCTKKDVKDIAMADDTYGAGPSYTEFSDSGESIYYSYYANNEMNRYMITSPGKDVHLLEYLALGDSFSSGEGDNDGGRYYVAGTDGNGETVNNTGITDFPYWKEKCHISSRSYPYLLASEADLTNSQFRSVACSGADLNDLLNTQSDGEKQKRYNGHFDQMDIGNVTLDQVLQAKDDALSHFIPGRASQIEFVQKYKPRVATISIGGNDIDFAKKLAECVPPTSTCRFATTDRATTGIEISLLYNKLVDAYDKLKTASPTTRFYVVGYPQIASGGGTCSTNVLLNSDEREYATYTVDYLDRVIAAAAAKAGLSYLDIENALVGKNLCSFADKSDLAVNGLETGNDRTIFGDSRHFGYLANESYHPNNIGHAMMANALRADMGYAAINTYNPCFPGIGLNCSFANSNLPSPLAYFGVPTDFSPIAHESVDLDDEEVQRGSNITVDVPTGNAFKPGTIVNFTLHSIPSDLGQATVAADGTVSTSLNIPVGTDPGYHTLHVTGITPANDSIDYYENIFVYANADDVDGDGILNEDDACGVIDKSGADEDKDGTDDACDGYIGTPPAQGAGLQSLQQSVAMGSTAPTATMRAGYQTAAQFANAMLDITKPGIQPSLSRIASMTPIPLGHMNDADQGYAGVSRPVLLAALIIVAVVLVIVLFIKSLQLFTS